MKRTFLFAILFMFLSSTAFASHYELSDIDLLPDSIVSKLETLKISTTESLFAKLMKKSDRAAFAKQYSLSASEVDVLAVKLELMQIVGIGPKAAKLLVLAGVENAKALAEAQPDQLLDALLRVNREQSITGVQPDLTVVRDWISKAAKVTKHIEK